MTDTEQEIFHNLAWMCEQYIGSGKMDYLDHEGMGAGEGAIDVLAKYGLVEPIPRGAAWTEAGRALLNSN